MLSCKFFSVNFLASPTKTSNWVALHICPELLPFLVYLSTLWKGNMTLGEVVFSIHKILEESLRVEGCQQHHYYQGKRSFNLRKIWGGWEVITESMRQQNPFYLVNFQNTSSQFCSLHPSCKEKARRYLSRKNQPVREKIYRQNNDIRRSVLEIVTSHVISPTQVH